MRSFFFILFLIGAGVAFLYPWAVRSVESGEVGRWQLYDAAGGFRPVDVALRAADSPVRLRVDLTAVVPGGFETEARPVLTLTVSGGGTTLLAEALNVGGAEVQDDSPQTPQRVYGIDVGPMDVPADGTYAVAAGAGEVDGVEILGVDLVMHAGLGAYDERAQPVGLSVMAIGFIGFVIAMRRAAARKAARGETPAQPRWGRGA
jgi:hypothetical protein